MENMASYITGIYGSSDFDAESMAIYDNKYFDIYPSNSLAATYNKKILGDATGELGPFYYYKESNEISYNHSTWYADNVAFVVINFPWFYRGASYNSGVIAGIFRANGNLGSNLSYTSFRIVLV